MEKRKRIGIFGWGIVAPKSPDIETFARNLEEGGTWLTPFRGFGPSNFLVGKPEFDWERYRPWFDERFPPAKFAQLSEKMGPMVKFAMGAFIQALGQNPGLEEELTSLGPAAHIYMGTGIGCIETVAQNTRALDRGQREAAHQRLQGRSRAHDRGIGRGGPSNDEGPPVCRA